MMNKLSLNDKMKLEALERLELLKASPLCRSKILNDWQLTKCIVNHDEKMIKDNNDLTSEENDLVRKFEKKYESAVYYVIQDEGMWPDGCKFPRYAFLYVSKSESEWQMEREECIENCKTIPAYVVNMEESECSELAEICFAVVSGAIINVS